ncbi:MAG TPA: non-homologous end-joining DNA ligase [Gemmatimonadales bacterium]
MNREATPRFVPPELATLVDAAPTGNDWVFEIKYDGYRLEAIVHTGRVQLLTRRGNDWTSRFPRLAEALGRLGIGVATLDGEVVVLDRSGRSRFALLQQSLDAAHDQDLTFFVFDLLNLDGVDLRPLPLGERRAKLERLFRQKKISARGPVRLGQRLDGDGKTLLRAACKLGLEGIIAKRLEAPYTSRRTSDWVKIKCNNRQEFVVIGFTPPAGTRAGLGSLLLAVHEDGVLRYAGRVGTGFSETTLRDLRRKLAAIETDVMPLSTRPAGIPRMTQWVRPKLVAEVAFTEWTDDGLLRHPAFHGLRDDKPAGTVRRERPR